MRVLTGSKSSVPEAADAVQELSSPFSSKTDRQTWIFTTFYKVDKKSSESARFCIPLQSAPRPPHHIDNIGSRLGMRSICGHDAFRHVINNSAMDSRVTTSKGSRDLTSSLQGMADEEGV